MIRRYVRLPHIQCQAAKARHDQHHCRPRPPHPPHSVCQAVLGAHRCLYSQPVFWHVDAPIIGVTAANQQKGGSWALARAVMSRTFELRAPEGVYTRRDWANPLQNRAAGQNDTPTSPTSHESAATPSRYACMNEVPHISAAIIRPRHATHAEASSSVPGALVSQGLEAEALGDATPLRSARPKLSLRTLGGSFIVRSNQYHDMSKIGNHRTEPTLFTVRVAT